MHKKTTLIFGIFLGLIVFSGTVFAVVNQGGFQKISGFAVQVTSIDPNGRDVDSGWRKVTGGASVVEIAETTIGSDRNSRVISRITPCEKTTNYNSNQNKCYKFEYRESIFRPKTIFYASIENVKGLASYLQNSCRFRNWLPRFRQNLNLEVSFRNANGGETRNIGLIDSFCTSFTAGDHSTGSEIDTNRLSIKVERIEIA